MNEGLERFPKKGSECVYIVLEEKNQDDYSLGPKISPPIFQRERSLFFLKGYKSSYLSSDYFNKLNLFRNVI